MSGPHSMRSGVVPWATVAVYPTPAWSVRRAAVHDAFRPRSKSCGDQSSIASTPSRRSSAMWSLIVLSSSGEVPLPIRDLAPDPQRIARAV